VGQVSRLNDANALPFVEAFGSEATRKRRGFLPDKKTYVASSFDSAIKLWDIATQRLIDTLETPGEFVNCLSHSADGKGLAAVTRQGRLHVWNLESRKFLHSIEVAKGIAETVAFDEWIGENSGRSRALSEDRPERAARVTRRRRNQRTKIRSTFPR
jgi:WD40 repeat protein